MGHNPNLIQLGTVRSNHRTAKFYEGDPATFKAGLKVHLSSTGALSLLKSAGFQAGISLGKNLSNDSKATAVDTKGLGVPVRLALKRASGVITISSFANLVSGTADVITVGATAFTAQAGAATPGAGTFQAASSNNATATSLAAQINAHATAGALVYAVASAATVTLYSKVTGVGGTGTGNDIALTYTNNDGNVGATLSGLSGGKLSGGSNAPGDIAYVVKGQKVYFNDITGEADANIAGVSTISDATYVDGIKASLEEDGTAGPPATYVDMPGGL